MPLGFLSETEIVPLHLSPPLDVFTTIRFALAFDKEALANQAF